MNMEKEIINQVVRAFYEKAISDVFIGYHFRKIVHNQETIHNIKPSLGDFEHHIPKVNDFWASQLIKNYKKEFDRPNVLKIHEYLRIRFGELGRWLTLFRETLLDFKNEENKEFINLWEVKLDQFELAFKNYFFKDT